jgi:hypothetical protein
VSPFQPRAMIVNLKTDLARRAVGRYRAVISGHRRDAYDTLGLASVVGKASRLTPQFGRLKV